MGGFALVHFGTDVVDVNGVDPCFDVAGGALTLEEASAPDFVLDLEINDCHAFGAFVFDFLIPVSSFFFPKL